MRYQNRVVSAIWPEVFRTPYIGAKAYEVQLAQKQEELSALKEKMQTLKAQKQAVEKAAGSLDTRADVAVKYQLSALEKDRADKAALAEVKKDLKAIGAEKTLIEKQIRLQQLQQDKKRLDAESRKLSESVGSVKNEIDGDRAKVIDLKSQAEEKSREVEALVERLGDDWKQTEERFQKELGRRESMGHSAVTLNRPAKRIRPTARNTPGKWKSGCTATRWRMISARRPPGKDIRTFSANIQD